MRCGRTTPSAVMAAVILLVFFGMTLCASADIISLIAYISSSLYEDDGVTPLADGTWVYIYGSVDNIVDPMKWYGDCYLPGSATGDDFLLGFAIIGQPPYVDSGNNVVPGTFLSDQVITWDDEEVLVNYLYIRFFDAAFPVGEVKWGESPAFEPVWAGPFVVEVDFIGGYLANQTNCFVIIPEPGTLNLIVLCAGLFAGVGAVSGRRRRAGDPAGSTHREVLKS